MSHKTVSRRQFLHLSALSSGALVLAACGSNALNSAATAEPPAEIRELINSGDLELFNGVPDSHPTGFVVNCPVPVLGDNTFAA